MHPRPTRAALAAALALSTAGFVVLPGLAAAANAAAPTTPYISEINYDNDGTDTGEFVEVHLPAGTSSSGMSLVLYNGSNNTVYGTVAVPTVTATDAPAVTDVDVPGIQNGAPDGLALVQDGTVLEFISYEGTMTVSTGAAAGMTSTDIGVSQTGSNSPVGHSLSRTYDPTADALVWYGPAANSRGAVNPPPTPPDPPADPPCEVEPTHQIGEVQGEGFQTPITDAVTVEGVVVGDLPSFGGFHLQDVDGDGNPATSDGVFVTSDVAVELGDTVAVTGVPKEDFGQTEIDATGGGSAAQVCEEGDETDLPEAAPLDLPAGAAEREKLEGMLVAPIDTLTVSEVFDLTSFGELTLSEGGLLVQPTELARPGDAAAAIAAENQRRRIVLDDGLDSRVSVTTRPYLSPTTPVRVGDQLTFTEPLVLGYGFSQWRLQPADGSADGVFEAQNTRPASPEAVGGDIQVAAFNVLNYFISFGPTSRGAANQAKLEEQASKIVPAIEALGAEVVTLMEIEDTDSTGHTPGDADGAMADLVQRLNAAAGSDKWAYVPFPEELYAEGVERDVIRNGIIYQPAAVELVGDSVGLVDESVWFNAREPIAQTFTAQGDAFTVVANHFKSKSPGNPAPVGNDNEDTGQGAWNGDRVRQAQSLAAFVDELRTSTGDEDLLLLGDFNAYSMEDPIETLRTAGFVNLGPLLDEGRYSYVFDDMSGSLDHALATQSLTEKVTDLVHWNINAVESFAYQYTGDPALYAPNPYRSSDHDPLVLGIDLDTPAEPEPAVTCLGEEATIVGTDGDDVLRGTDGRDVFVGLGGNDKIVGLGGPDLVCAGKGADIVKGGDGSDVLRGERGNDKLVGGKGSDQLFGGKGNDLLLGGKGTDELDGGPGKDVLRPGKQ